MPADEAERPEEVRGYDLFTTLGERLLASAHRPASDPQSDTGPVMSDELTWKKLASREGPELPLFRVRLDRLQHPTSDRTFERLVLEAPDWVNVAAVTDDGRIVMVEQYRFGVGALTLEPVGGLVDAGEDC